MAVVRVLGTGEEAVIDPVTSILVALQRKGIGIETVCGGRAQCGRCVVRIVSGGEKCSKKKPPEAHRLEILKAGEDMRLACQTYTVGDIEIEIINRPV